MFSTVCADPHAVIHDLMAKIGRLIVEIWRFIVKLSKDFYYESDLANREASAAP